MMKSTTPVYTESLRVMPKLTLWILAVVTILTVVLALIFGDGERGSGAGDNMLWGIAVMALIWWFALASRIKLRLDEEGVSYQFWPLPKKKARWEALKGWYLREVSAFGEFGGWGMRWGFHLGWGYVNTSDWGLQLVYKNDKRVVISTEQPEALRHWLELYAPGEVVETGVR